MKNFISSIPIPVDIILLLLLLLLAMTIKGIIQIIDCLRAGLSTSFKHTFEVGVGIYCIGNICKFALIGPSFVRWHLGDFGFAICATYIIYSILSRRIESPEQAVFKKANKRNLKIIREWLTAERKNFVVSICSGFVACLSYEIFSGYLVDATNKKGMGIGSFDYIDVLMYLLAALLLLLITIIQKRVSNRILDTVSVIE